MTPPPTWTPRGLRQRRAQQRELQQAVAARRGEELRAEARGQGRAAAAWVSCAPAAADAVVVARAQLAGWAGARVRAAHGTRILPPAPDHYQLGHAGLGLVLGLCVLVASWWLCEVLADRGHISAAALLFLVGLFGGPGVWLALSLPKLVDPRVRYWSEQLLDEALREGSLVPPERRRGHRWPGRRRGARLGGRPPTRGATGVFSTGDTVTITGATMTGNVGTVVHHDAARDLYLVRVGAVTQVYVPAAELELFTS